MLVDLVARRFDSPPVEAVRIDATRPMAEVCRAAVNEVSARIARERARS
jgi:hypothetical protein